MDAGKITNSGMSTTNANRVLKKADADDAAQINTVDSFTSSGSSSKPENIEDIKKKLLQKKFDAKIEMDHIWKGKFPDLNGIYSGPVIGKDDKIFVGTTDSKVIALDPGNGNQLWSFDCNGSWVDIGSSSICPDGTIYANDADKRIFAINLQNGQKKWSLTLDDDISKSLIATPDGAIIVGYRKGKVHAFDSKGQKLWENKVEDEINWEPFAPGDGRIYIESSGALHALDEKTGKDLWKISDEAEPCFLGSTIAKDSNDTIYAATYKDDLYAIDSKNGSVKWKSKIEKQAFIPKPTFDPKGETILLNFDNTRLSALDVKDGSVKWDFADESNNDITCTATPLFLPDGNILYGIGTRKLYILDPANGSKKIEQNMDMHYLGNPTIKDNYVYFRKYGNIDAFKMSYKCDDTKEQQQTGEPAPNPEIIKDGENVVIGGVKIPVRPNKPQQE